MVASQIVRLHQTDATAWIATDYAGRIGALAVLAAIPAARAVAYRREALRIGWLELVIWVAALVAFYRFPCDDVRILIDKVLPGTKLGDYPEPHGWLNLVDLSFGLALVAIHEEIVFRRCARAVFADGDGKTWTVIFGSALIFAAYHWTTGLGNIVAAAMFGIPAMAFYHRSGALWPVILAHFLTDVVEFS
jgi:membrane protease YdiL (CAAX protease family)